MVDVRLYLPRAWAKYRARRKRCGIPKVVRYRMRHDLALEMLEEIGPLLPPRTALARFYRWKKSKHLAPLRKRLLS